jgi:hypothetical protein
LATDAAGVVSFGVLGLETFCPGPAACVSTFGVLVRGIFGTDFGGKVGGLGVLVLGIIGIVFAGWISRFADSGRGSGVFGRFTVSASSFDTFDDIQQRQHPPFFSSLDCSVGVTF